MKENQAEGQVAATTNCATTFLFHSTLRQLRGRVDRTEKARCQAKFLTSANFLTYYFLSVIFFSD